MKRYIVERPRAGRASWWESTPQSLPQPTVTADEPRDTGLLDCNRNRILALPAPCGFIPIR